MNNLLRGILILLIPVWANGQTTHLTLQEALDAAQKNNQSIKLSQLEADASSAQFKQTQAVFLPQVNVSYTAITTNNPLNAFGLKLQQQAITASDFNPALLNNPSGTQIFMKKIELQQPIINLDLIYQRQAAGKQAEALLFKHQRTRQYVAFELEKAYAQLQLSHRAVAVMEQAVISAKAVALSTQHRFEQGYLQQSDILQVQVQVANLESKLAEANSNVQNASDYLGLLMGMQPGTVYETDTLAYNQPGSSRESIPENRADFAAMQAAVQARENILKSNKMTYAPKLNAFGEFMFNDSGAFGFGSDAYLIGAQLSWTVFNGTATHHRISNQRIERDKAARELEFQKAQAQLELSKTTRQLQDTQNLVNQQTLASAQAKEVFRLMQNRYAQGLITTTELLQAQTMMAQQELGQAQAQAQLIITQAYLSFLTTTPNL